MPPTKKPNNVTTTSIYPYQIDGDPSGLYILVPSNWPMQINYGTNNPTKVFIPGGFYNIFKSFYK